MFAQRADQAEVRKRGKVGDSVEDGPDAEEARPDAVDNVWRQQEQDRRGNDDAKNIEDSVALDLATSGPVLVIKKARPLAGFRLSLSFQLHHRRVCSKPPMPSDRWITVR